MDFELVPLLKGLKIGKIITELIEVQDFTLEQISQVNKHFKGRRLIKEDEWELPEDWPVADIDGQDGSRFVRSLQIPMNLKECIQDVEVKGIMVKHKLKFCVKLINPDSHVSEVGQYFTQRQMILG